MAKRELVIVIDGEEARRLILEGERFLSDLCAMSPHGLGFVMFSADAESLTEHFRTAKEGQGASVQNAYRLFAGLLKTEPSSTKERAESEDSARRLIALAKKHKADWVVTSEALLLEHREVEGFPIADRHRLYLGLASEQRAVLLARIANEHEAELLRQALENVGIHPFIKAQQIPWYDGILAFAEGYYGDLYVLAKDREKAQAVVNELRQSMQEELSEEELAKLGEGMTETSGKDDD
jgi:hypothetical protein